MPHREAVRLVAFQLPDPRLHLLGRSGAKRRGVGGDDTDIGSQGGLTCSSLAAICATMSGGGGAWAMAAAIRYGIRERIASGESASSCSCGLTAHGLC